MDEPAFYHCLVPSRSVLAYVPSEIREYDEFIGLLASDADVTLFEQPRREDYYRLTSEQNAMFARFQAQDVVSARLRGRRSKWWSDALSRTGWRR